MAETRILVVDDEPAVCRVIRRMLKRSDWNVEILNSPEQALERVAEGGFDLYILDKNMPRVSGLTLAAKIRTKDTVAGIVMFTGYDTIESALTALHTGIDGYLVKPANRQLLSEVVEGALAAAARRRERPARPGLTELKIIVAGGVPSAKLAGELSEAGHDVAVVSSSVALSELLGQGTPDLLVVDANLEGPDIFQVLTQARTNLPRQALAVTWDGPPGVETVKRLIDLGVEAVVDWQTDSATLISLIDKLRQPIV
ncbi:response regulator [Myxococcota bacterium]